MSNAVIQDGQLLIDGKSVRIISGAIHYFRVHPGLWEDRLDKAVACGLNAIETYFCWNLHEPAPGQFDFTGILDFERFLDLAAERGLYAIVRPGPYICAEWENGGFPGWLAAVPGIRLRVKNKPYLDAVERYFKQLLPRLRKHLLCNGGNIIAAQVENEYGSYGCDTEYLKYIRDLMIREGFDRTILFTSDGADSNHYLNGGRCPGCLTTANFGSASLSNFERVRTYQPKGPDFCMEWWLGWFDHWGEQHHDRNAESAVEELKTILNSGAHVNMYMFHGGTNFGFTAGANGNFLTDYAPTTTSYDYDAPLSEAGDPAPKFEAFQKLIADCTGAKIRPVTPSKKCVPSPVCLTETLPLSTALPEITHQEGKADIPPTMEELAPDTTGFIYYRRHLAGPLTVPIGLRLFQVNDYAQVYLNGKYQGYRWRPDGQDPFMITCGPEGVDLELLVENCGRINYGPYVGFDRKGIAGFVALEFQIQTGGWEYRTLPLTNPPKQNYGTFNAAPGCAAFHRGSFEVSEIGETFIETPGEKGVIWINGFNIGRYWKRGPQKRLYVPSPLLKPGRNEIVVFGLEKLDSAAIPFSAEPDLGDAGQN